MDYFSFVQLLIGRCLILSHIVYEWVILPFIIKLLGEYEQQNGQFAFNDVFFGYNLRSSVVLMIGSIDLVDDWPFLLVYELFTDFYYIIFYIFDGLVMTLLFIGVTSKVDLTELLINDVQAPNFPLIHGFLLIFLGKFGI